MKSFWALPAVLRVAVAAQNSFSVQDDVLAFPQVQDADVLDLIAPTDCPVVLGRLSRRPCFLSAGSGET